MSKFSAMRDDLTDFGIAELTLLQMPTKHHLRSGLAERLADRQQHRLVERAFPFSPPR